MFTGRATLTLASPGFELLKNIFFKAIFSKIIDVHDFPIKDMFLGSYLGSVGSGMSRNVFLSYFLPVVHAAGVFSSEQIRHRASVHEVGVWFSLQGRPTGTPHRKALLEKWQSHCSEKVNEIDFSKAVPKFRN